MTEMQDPIIVPQQNRYTRELRHEEHRKMRPSDLCSLTDSDFHSASIRLSVGESSKDLDSEDALYEKILREVDIRLQQSRTDVKHFTTKSPSCSSTREEKLGKLSNPIRYSPSQESLLIRQLTGKYLKDK